MCLDHPTSSKGGENAFSKKINCLIRGCTAERIDAGIHGMQEEEFKRSNKFRRRRFASSAARLPEPVVRRLEWDFFRWENFRNGDRRRKRDDCCYGGGFIKLCQLELLLWFMAHIVGGKCDLLGCRQWSRFYRSFYKPHTRLRNVRRKFLGGSSSISLPQRPFNRQIDSNDSSLSNPTAAVWDRRRDRNGSQFVGYKRKNFHISGNNPSIAFS